MPASAEYAAVPPLLWDHLPVTAEDDPEARIRELERSLADQAHSSELGAEQTAGPAYLPPPTTPYAAPNYTPPNSPAPAYGNPPPYSSPQFDGQPYGTQDWGAPQYGQFPASTRRSSAGIPWAVFIVIAVVFLVAVGVGAVIWTTRSAMHSSGVSGGGGAIDIPTIPSIAIPSMPSIPAAPTAPDTDPNVMTGVAGQDLTVSGIDENKKVTCNDANVSVSGIRNTVNITGDCAKISVSGMNNVVTVDAADTIGASGFDNRVTFHTGSPHIDSMGSNVVAQG